MVQRKVSTTHKIRKVVRNKSALFHPTHHRYKWLLLANVMIGTFMAVLDATIVNVGLPKIMARGLPGNLVLAKRAGMIPRTFIY